MNQSIQVCTDWYKSDGIVDLISTFGTFIGIFVAMIGYGTLVATICIVGLIISLLIAGISAHIGLTISEEMEEEEN